MPSVKKDTTPAEGGMEGVARLAPADMTTTGTAGSAVPKQQAAHIEHEWA